MFQGATTLIFDPQQPCITKSTELRGEPDQRNSEPEPGANDERQVKSHKRTFQGSVDVQHRRQECHISSRPRKAGEITPSWAGERTLAKHTDHRPQAESTNNS